MSLLHLFSRLSVGAVNQFTANQSIRNISVAGPLLIRPTQCLYKEPLKRRKKLDPAMMKAKEEKKKRKLEKEIRRLSKYAQTLKPIEEMQLPLHIQDQRVMRERAEVILSPEEEERRALLLKEWSTHRIKQHMADLRMLDSLEHAQRYALNQLRMESEELYQAAIQVDLTLLPITTKGPTLSPPIKNYDSPDGDYVNTSFKWE